MDEQAYVVRHLRKSVTYRNLLKIDDFKSDETLKAVCQTAVLKIDNEDVWAAAFKEISVSGKVAYTLVSSEAILVHNLLMKNLVRAYKIKVTDRDNMIRLLISNMKDCHGFYIHRLDIKSFYESFDRREIYRKLMSDSFLSKKSINVLHNLFDKLDSMNCKGLPRGLGISSTLSEVMFKDFDLFLKKQKGILFYARFVDDIILLTDPTVTKLKLTDYIRNSPLPKGMFFHEKGRKVKHSLVKKTHVSEGGNASNIIFDFLGYEFSVETIERVVGDTIDIEIRNVDIKISDDKINKIKKRILQSFVSFISSKNEKKLLIKRLYFLSRNYQLTKSSTKKVILSGIFYNYKYVTNAEKISLIDDFYQNLLFNKKSNLSKRLFSNMSYSERLSISKISFKDGFEKRKFTRFSYKELRDVKKAWI